MAGPVTAPATIEPEVIVKMTRREARELLDDLRDGHDGIGDGQQLADLRQELERVLGEPKVEAGV